MLACVFCLCDGLGVGLGTRTGTINMHLIRGGYWQLDLIFTNWNFLLGLNVVLFGVCHFSDIFQMFIFLMGSF